VRIATVDDVNYLPTLETRGVPPGQLGQTGGESSPPRVWR
jgi:hypothetical protein